MDADEAIKRWGATKLSYPCAWQSVTVDWMIEPEYRYSEYTGESAFIKCEIQGRDRRRKPVVLTGTFDFGEIIRDLVAFAQKAEE